MKDNELLFDRKSHVLYSKPCKKEILAKIALHYPEAERETVWEKVQRQYPHMEKRGSRYLRYALFNATKYVCHWDSNFAAYLAKKRAEGKHYNVAISHAAKKTHAPDFRYGKIRDTLLFDCLTSSLEPGPARASALLYPF